MMLSRFCSTCAVAFLALSSSTTALAAGFGESNLRPVADESDADRDFEVGSRLMATSDVKLRDVTLSKGSRVVVRGLEVKRGRAATFDVELADGQVLKHVDAATVRRSFVIAND